MIAALAELSIERAALVTEEAVSAGAVLVTTIEAPWVSETPTGLAFAPDTPLVIWAPLVVRLIVQSKRLEFALADALIFGELAYGDLYAQWATETGLNKRTLQNYARVGRSIPPARRRASVSFSHHEAVLPLPERDQDRLLDAAEEHGWTRYELRDAVRERREQLRGREIEPVESLVWTPTKGDLTPEAREALEQKLAGIGKRHHVGYERAWLDALLWLDARDCFREWKGP